MFIVAVSLDFTGGSTFILRTAREYRRRGEKLGVLILTANIDKGLYKQLSEVADVFKLSDFIPSPLRWAFKTQLSIFAPIFFRKLLAKTKSYGRHIHVMGIIGLLFVVRMSVKFRSSFVITAGIYHQYEYAFDSSYFFVKYAQRLFVALGRSGVIFLNEANKLYYSNFFKTDYLDSYIVPVGIELPDFEGTLGSSNSYRIVSIGNLYPFKTYNLHIVKLMPSLLEINKDFTYAIYGEGELEDELKSLVTKLGLQDKVSINKRIPYAEFSNALHGAFLFVGSGTALVEASALGIPSLVGIESTREPKTFGFLSDISGFSYNELNDSQPLVLMYDCINSITDENRWKGTASSCREKAKEFSISRTVDCFELIEVEESSNVPTIKLLGFRYIRLFISFIGLSVSHVLSFDRGFSSRRN